MPSVSTVLFDLDGVIRHFDASARQAIEADAGLDPGALWHHAFDQALIHQVVTGQMTRAAWTDEVGRRVGNPDAARRWLAQPGKVDPHMVELIDELRTHGRTVAVLTNGTDTIPDELDELGLTPHLDAIFNTADIGFAKPDPRAFQHACAALGVVAQEVFFIDDSESKLGGAIEIGMQVHHFRGLAPLRTRLIDVGVLPT